jgi:antitoxin (DNA-binding transcriptional repressor) of toxin-antitoxin stability system
VQRVGIAELKARLSEYLHAVRRGETIATLHRDTPVAQIAPYQERPALRVRKPMASAPPLNQVRVPRSVATHVDVVQLLLEERQPPR